ncbi:protein kinase domain-containing protein [Derxia lacustris]|uniref:protein kinase domain-containing protein n=1 Tax=Derxia lacustris TaxID=764842 RepID=UPI0015946301|nr:winged helix-turn-helix domain-containing protein [Derxia lacustris]
MTNLYRYRFGSVVFDQGSFELSVDGGAVEIQRKPLQVLNLLLQNAGKAVPREEFIREVWRGQPTVDNVLANAIAKLRNAIGPAHAQHIESIPRVGYRLSVAIERTAISGSDAGMPKFRPGDHVPQREHFRLERRFGASEANDVWLARHIKTGEERVFKFASAEQHMSSLKREVTLARLLRNALGDRPDFVRIIDWNFSEPPYFVESEYGGVNLAEWAGADGRLAALALQDRLALFLQIAQAVASAHSLAVLHKDLKPTNVLVEPAGAGWQCRLVDFGSGRLLDMARLGVLGITPLGLTVVNGIAFDAARGTLLYTAPELLADEPATVRSDIYALGVLLYQIVVGDLQRGLAVGWERDIDDELLRADIARATDGDPVRRFGSASELAEALAALPKRHEARRAAMAEARQRQIEGEQLLALRRRRPWLYAVIGVLLAGLLTALELYAQLRTAREQTAHELATKSALNKFLIDDFIEAANPALAGRRDVTVAEAARTAAGKVDGTLVQTSPEVRAGIHAALHGVFNKLSDFPSALAEGRKAVAEWARSTAPDVEQRGFVMLTDVYLLAVSGHLDEAEKLLADAEALLKPLKPVPPELQAELLFQHGSIHVERRQFEDAFRDYAQAWAIARQPGFADPVIAGHVEGALSNMNTMLGHHAQAEQLARDLMERQVAIWGADHVRTCFTAFILANTLGYQNRADEGLALADKSIACLTARLGAQSTGVADARVTRATLLAQARRYREAAVAFGEVADLYGAVLGPNSEGRINAIANQAAALRNAGQLTAADVVFGAGLKLGADALGQDHPTMQALKFGAARTRLDMGRTAGVAVLLQGLDADALNESEQAPDWPARLALQRGRLALLSGDRARAAELLGTARALEAGRNDAADAIREIDDWLVKAGAAPRLAAAVGTRS